MGEIEEWFEIEFSHLGFSLSPLMYDTTNFSPMRGVMFESVDGLRMTRIRITPELVNDVSGWGVPNDFFVQELKELVRQEIYRFLEEPLEPIYTDQFLNKSKDFTPKKKVTKLRFK